MTHILNKLVQLPLGPTYSDIDKAALQELPYVWRTSPPTWFIHENQGMLNKIILSYKEGIKFG